VVTDQPHRWQWYPLLEHTRIAPTDEHQLGDPGGESTQQLQAGGIRSGKLRVGDDRGQGAIEVEAEDDPGQCDPG
jgi:hypothetical protein